MTAPFKVVEVEWVGSHVDADWQALDDVARVSAQIHALAVTSVGLLIVEEDEHVVLASSWAPMPSGRPIVGCTTQIPRSAIARMRTVKAAPRARPR